MTTSQADADRRSRSEFVGRLKQLEFQEYALAVVVVLLFIAGAILKPDTFPTWDNVRNMLTQASVIGVLAMGMTFVIATAGIDLSVGSMVAAAGMFGGVMLGDTGTSTSRVHRVALVFATALGTVNAVAIAYGRVVPFIATLAMFSIGRGIALLLNDKLPVSLLDLNGGNFGDPAVFSLLWFGNGRILGIPVSVYVFLAITVGAWVLLNRTRYGRHVISVGGNREAARIAGVPVRRIIFSVYVLMGVLAGVADRAALRAARQRLARERQPLRARRDRGRRHRRHEPRRRPGQHRRHVPWRTHLRAHLQPDDAAESLDRGSAGDQGPDRPRRRPASAAGGPLLMGAKIHNRRYCMSLRRLCITIAAARCWRSVSRPVTAATRRQ